MSDDSLTYQHARICAAQAPEDLKTGFVLGGALIILEVIYYSFQLLKDWRAGACNSSPARESIVAAYVGGVDEFSPAMTRQVSRRVKRAARFVRRKYGKDSDDLDQIDTQRLANHILSYTMKASSLDVATCCNEPIPAEIGTIE